MGFLSIFKDIVNAVKGVDNGVKINFKFSQKEINEIMSICKKENLKYFEILAKIPNMKYFDISFLLSEVELDDNKIELIKEAQKIYNEEEFSANGQTQSDFIFRVAANLNYLTMENIGIFKELVKCKNELYDFEKALKNPLEHMVKKETELKYAFEKIYTNN